MNDFTKEELKEIQDCLPFSCNPKMGFTNKLFDKLQVMIDNYCEPDIYQTSSSVSHCSKCGKCSYHYENKVD
jgi:hypothetical protein